MTEPFPTDPEQRVGDFIRALRASVKVRRYAEAYLDRVAHGGSEPREFKVAHGQPSFSYLQMRIDRILKRGRSLNRPPPRRRTQAPGLWHIISSDFHGCMWVSRVETTPMGQDRPFAAKGQFDA